MSVRKLLPVAVLLAVVSIRCAGSPADPIGSVSVTRTTTTTTTSVIPAVAAGAISLSPAGTPLAGATVVNFSTQASGGVPPYTFQWNFGDGQAGSGNPASHVFPIPGTFPATVTVADSRGQTGTATANVPVRSVTGTWNTVFSAPTPPGPPAPEPIDLVQNGGAVVVSVNDSGNLFGLGAGSGNVTNPRALSINLTFLAGTPLAFAGTLVGTLDSTLTSWTGTATGYPGCPCTFTATRVPVAGVLSTPR
jgi:PKD domain-containing protein